MSAGDGTLAIISGWRGWGAEREFRVPGLGRVLVSVAGVGGVLPGTRWDFFRDRVAVIRYVARLFPTP